MKKGTLLLILSFLLIGQMSIAQTGIYDVTGDLTMGSSHTYEVQIANTSGAGTGNDQINTTGNATIDGTLDIVLDGYTVNDADSFGIIAYAGIESGTFSTINWPASMVGWQIDYGTLNPNKVTIYGPLSTLPVEWVSVSVRSQDGNHLLTWQTASEINSDYYIVEHCKDGTTYSTLDKVSSKGNSYQNQSYSYLHHSPTKGNHYYRLQQVDKDGKTDYSKIVSIRKTSETAIQYYPNPVSDILHFNQKVTKVVIYDITGKEMLQASQVTDIDVSQLQSGNYIIDFNNGEIKQNIIISK